MRTASTATRLAAALAVALLLAAGEGLASAARDAPDPPDHAPMEQVLSKCIQELAGINDIIKGCLVDNMFGDSSAMNLDAKFLAKDQMLKAVNHLPSKVKQAIFDCFANHQVIVREDGNSGNWCIEYIELLIRSNAVSRRTLAEHTMQIMSSHFASVSPTATAVFQSLAPSQFPSPDPPNATKSVPIDTTVPTKNDKQNHSEGANSRHQSQTGSNASRAPSRNGTGANSAHDKDGTMPVTVAVIITGLVSFVLAACAFLIFDKFCRKSNRSDSFRKDEKPLLTLSPSDFSADSSKKLYGLEGASYNDNNGTLSFKSGPSPKKNLTFSKVHPSEIPPAVVTLGISNSLTVAPSSQSTLTPVPSAVPAPPPVVPPPPPPAQKAPPSGPPPPPLPNAGGPRPPPPPKGGAPRPPPSGAGPRKAPPGSNRSAGAASDEDNSSKTKLKPFFWDKVLANPDQSMVWHQISSGSFQFNEEMIESLFGCTVADKQKGNAKKGSAVGGGAVQQVQILDPKKSQNLAILLRALNVTTQEVLEALMEGNELPSELLQTLLKMAPTSEEEFKLRLYSGDLSLLGPAERFLKALVDIPFVFKRLDALLYMGSLHEDMSSVKESFATVETACTELRSSRLFLKILEAVLKTGNRMNDGTYRGGAQAFKLDTLLKLSDVKGTDGKITLLHFVVQEIIRSEGMKAARIARESGSFSGFSFKSQDLVIDDSPVDAGDHIWSLGLNVVSGLGNELENVKKAAALDADTLTNTVAILGHGLVKTRDFLNKDMKSIEEDSEFHRSLDCFVEHAEKDIASLLEEEKRIRLLVKNTSDYFHGNAAKDEGLRLFIIVRDFLGMIDKVCHEIKQAPAKKVQKPPANNAKEGNTSQPVPDPRRLLFPAIAERRPDSSDSDYDSP